MSDKWMIRGAEFVNCNCDYGCPCQFNSPSTDGFCEAISNVSIEEGNFNETSLNGLKFCLVLKWPGEIADGNGRSQLIIDEGTDENQRDAINKIAHGESTAPGSTHFFVFNSTMSEVLETLYARIEMSIDVGGREAHTKIEGLVETSGSPIVSPFTGEPDRKGIHLPNGFEYVYAEMGNGNTKVTAGLELDLSDSYGQFNVLHMNQDGVIRDQEVPV